MSSKKDELRAFKKLQAAFPNEVVSLECCYDNIRDGKMMIFYTASHMINRKGTSSYQRADWRDTLTTPMAAVDFLISLKEEA
jgi:hypothetical protein